MRLWKRGRIRMWWTPHDVRLLRDSIILAMQIASKAWEAFNLGAYDIAGWRQLKHLIITVNNAYLEINTTKKRETNPELVSAIPTKFKTSHHSALWGLLLNVSFVNYFAEFSSEEHILDVITTHRSTRHLFEGNGSSCEAG